MTSISALLKILPPKIFFANRFVAVFGIFVISAELVIFPHPTAADAQNAVEVRSEVLSSPSEANELELQKFTWTELKSKLEQGVRTVIVPVGGIEQNGPFVVLEKHDLIVKEAAKRLASRLGNTLVAPVVSFVPQGGFSPPSGHLLYPGTIGVRDSTFEDLLEDICRSLIIGGFEEIILIGDSGGNQQGMHAVASNFRGSAARVRYIPEFYNYSELTEFLRERGYRETEAEYHESLPFTAQLFRLDPTAVRFQQRVAESRAAKVELNGVDISNRQALSILGEEIFEWRVDRTLSAIFAHRARSGDAERAKGSRSLLERFRRFWRNFSEK